MAMILQDRRILLASLVEVKELWHEHIQKGQLNSAEELKPIIYDRALRVENGNYFDPDNPTAFPHRN